MINNLELTRPEIELVKTEKLKLESNLMTLEEYIDYLEFTSSDELPPLSESAQVVVDKLSQKYSKVMFGNKFRYADHTGETIVFHDPANFQKFNADMVVPYLAGEKRKEINVFDLFNKSRSTPKYSNVEFNPARSGDYGNTKNLFRGFPYNYEPQNRLELKNVDREDLLAFADSFPKSRRFIEHVWDNISDGEHGLAHQVIAWLADIIQNPERSPSTALVLRGEEKGTGKTTIADIIGECIGSRHYMKSSNEDHVLGKFNSHLVDKLLVCGEEMSWGGDTQRNNKVKDFVTTSHLPYEFKGVDVVQGKKYFRMMLVTNETWAVNASTDERRYIVCVVNPKQAQNTEYFSPFYSSGGNLCREFISDVFKLLSSLDITGVDLSKCFNSKGMKAQKRESMSNMQKFWADSLEDGGITLPHTIDPKGTEFIQFSGNHTDIIKKDIYASYKLWVGIAKPKGGEHHDSQRMFGTAFTKMMNGHCSKSLFTGSNIKKHATNAYRFGPLSSLRESFDKQFN